MAFHSAMTGANLHRQIRWVQSADPAGSANDGDLWLDTDDGRLRVREASAWVLVTAVGDVTSVNGSIGVVVLDADDIGDASTTKKFTTAAEISKLAGIEAGADVTDEANVDAAGAVMNADTSTASMSFVIDEDSFATNSATKIPTQQSVKAYVDAQVGGVGYTDEQARDAIGAALVAGTGISVVVSDPSDTITVNSTITQYTDEMAQDAVGAALTDTTSIDLTYDDVGNAISAAVILEWLQDTIASMFTGGSHTNITTTYQDATGVIDLVSTVSGGAVATDPIFDAKGDLAVGTGADTASKLAVGSNGQRVKANSAEATGLQWVDDVYTVNFLIDGGGSAISSGIKGDVVLDAAGTIVSATALADQSGSITVDLWKDTYANFPPVVGDSIVASAPITISSATKSQDTTLTGWTTTVAAGDIIRFNVNATATSITRVTISLKIRKT